MFDVKKLAKLLEEIFTRDNENFSPELVAEELMRLANDFIIQPALFRYDYCDHNSGMQQFKYESDRREMNATGDIADDEFQEILATFTIREFLPNQNKEQHMVYIIPQPLKCTRCGHEHEASLHKPEPNIVFGAEIYCHKCISEFLRNNVGVMKCTIDFTGDGSEYDRAERHHKN